MNLMHDAFASSQLWSRMFSPSRAKIGESGFSRYDVPVPPSSASSLSGGRREAGRQAFQQEGGCLGFPQGFPGNVVKAIRKELTG